jgi:hypothetical protein
VLISPKISLSPHPNGTISHNRGIKNEHGRKCGSDHPMVTSEPNQQWRTMVASEKNLEFNAASRRDNGFRLLHVKEKKVSHGKERTKKTNP